MACQPKGELVAVEKTLPGRSSSASHTPLAIKILPTCKHPAIDSLSCESKDETPREFVP